MKILIIADERPEVGSLTLSLIDAFSDSGFEVTCLHPPNPKPLRFLRKDSLSRRIIFRFLHAISFFSISLYLMIKLRKVVNYEFVLVVKGLNLSRRALNELKKSGAFVVCFNPDDPYNLASSGPRILDCIPLYNHYFIWSKRIREKIFSQYGVPSTYLPFAADPKLHRLPAKPNVQRVKSRISFIGNWDDERENWLDCVERKDLLRLYGVNWERKLRSPDLKTCVANRAVVGKDLSLQVNSSQINLNILRVQNKGSCNMRTFEIPISGGFQLHEYSEEVACLFEEGKEIEFFRNAEELNKKINYYLENPVLTAAIAKAGREKMFSENHFYLDRAAKIWRVVDESQG